MTPTVIDIAPPSEDELAGGDTMYPVMPRVSGGRNVAFTHGRPILLVVVADEGNLRSILETLDPKAREHLRDVLIRDQADRDAIASLLMRYRDQAGSNWADVIDFLTMRPEARRQVGRTLAEIDATS